MDISRRQWDLVVERISKLEGKVRMLESRLELIDKKIKPQEIYRIVKQQKQEEALNPKQPNI